MKQLLFLLLFPCLCMAQYPANGNQKITLGEQTTADGLVFRGVENDTALITPLSDTSAYIILDTVNNKFYNYNRATNVWSVAGGGVSVSSFSAGTTGLTPSTATTGAVTLGGTLAVANGGTGATTLSPNNYLIRTNSSGIFDTSAVYEIGGNVGIGTTSPNYKLDISGTVNTSLLALRSSTNPSSNNYVGIDFGTGNFNGGLPNRSSRILGFADGGNDAIGLSFYTSNAAAPTEKMRITSTGNVGIGTASPLRKLTISGTTNSVMRIEATSTNGEPSFELYGKNSSGDTRSFVFKYDNSELLRLGITQNVPMRFETNDISRLFIKGTGEVGIGTDAPAVQFHTTSNVRFAGLASITDLRTDADGDLFNGSDFNLKNSIDTINFGLSDVLKLKPVSFNWNDEARNINEYKSMGFIAQDIMDVIPNAASTMGDGDMQVDYNAIVATLTKAIQEQQALIKALEQRLLILENK